VSPNLGAVARRLSVIVPLLFVLAACAGGGTTPAGAPAAATLAEANTGSASPAAPATADATTPSPSGTPAAGALLGGTPGSSPGTSSGASAPLATAAAGEGDASGEDPGEDLPGLVLEAGGLGVITADTHITHLGFGTSAKRVRATVARLVGPLASRRRTCGGAARTVSTTHGFSVVAAGDRFVGWIDHGSAGRHLSTADGVAVGMSVAELLGGGTEITVHRAASGTVTWTSGPDGLSGRATGPAPDGRVTTVSSGQVC
jgi:hypothetical protein